MDGQQRGMTMVAKVRGESHSMESRSESGRTGIEMEMRTSAVRETYFMHASVVES